MTHFSPWSIQTAHILQSLGHEVHVFDFSLDENDLKTEAYRTEQTTGGTAVSGIHLVRPFHRSKLKYVVGALQLRLLARRLRADLILSLYGGGLALMAYLSRIRPFAVYLVGSDILRATPLNRRINKTVLSAASSVFANGLFLAEKAREQVPGIDVTSLLLGVNVERLKVSQHSAPPVRMICTREFADVYNNESIIEAVAAFPDDVPDFRLIFVSGGATLRKNIELADRILSPQLRPKVEFWGGVEYEQLLAALGQSSIFLSMSRSDGTATSVLEAMGTGLFPILSDIPQNRVLLDHQMSNGILVPLDNCASLTEAMIETLRNPKRCAAGAAARREFIRQQANAVTNGRVLASRLEALVHGESHAN